MDSIPNAAVTLQLVPESAESIPPWFAELVVLVETLRRQGGRAARMEEVKLVRKRMGTFETFDCLAVLPGYAVSGLPTLQRFFARTKPDEEAFMGLFGRDTLPSPAALSRFRAAMTPSCSEAVRAQFERFSCGLGWTAETLGG